MPDLAGYEWLVFTSVNGVRRLLRPRPRAPPASTPARWPGLRVAAIGPGTARALARARHPRRSPARALRRRVSPGGVPAPADAGARVLLARAERRRDVLPDGLGARGYAVDVLPVYRTVPATPDPAAIARVASGPSMR